jgi:hypothetical protein
MLKNVLKFALVFAKDTAKVGAVLVALLGLLNVTLPDAQVNTIARVIAGAATSYSAEEQFVPKPDYTKIEAVDIVPVTE